MDFEKWQIIYRCSFVLFMIFLLITVICVFRFRIISVIRYRLSVRNEQDASVIPSYTPVTSTAVRTAHVSEHDARTADADICENSSGTVFTPGSSGTVVLTAKERYSEFTIVKNIIVMSADKDRLIK